MWSSIANTILNHPDLRDISFIVDHNGSAAPTDFGTLEFANFIRLLESGRLYVKIGALHRRSDNIALMEPVVKAYANAAPNGIVWGSDWPHVNTTIKGLTPTPPIEVNTDEELRLLRSWLTDIEWNKMLVLNPRHAFSVEAW
ncbi:amidohydrolase 2 [Fusarium heterosporum]|uniref:Amidohydrolase 2 n=1 Tax=Fusarium heterosporum TaxID=42747 RepID=A0A8H5U4E5_FUSHE|nr:amidohydrolase 2 [Fusarium heterosporum]